jgi:hypothetical protein
MNIAEVFNIAAQDYDTTRKKNISCFDEFYGVALDQIPYNPNDRFQIEKLYEKAWLEQAIAKGCTEYEIEVALERMKADKTLPLSTQLNLLEAHGFQNINCWYQYYRYAVYSGVKSR